MSKLVSTIGSSHKIEQVISEAREFIVIVTPYLKITKSLLSRLFQADKRGVKILLIYGKNEISKEQSLKLKSFQNINIYFLKDLHAKCYINEFTGLISSMNLYEYSQVNNWELGVTFELEDTLLADKLLGEIDLMIDASEIKKESFKKFDLVKKKFLERLTEYLNNYFKTDKFKYEKEIEEFIDEYFEEISAIGFPNKNINIEIDNDGTRIDFILNYSQNKLIDLKSKINLKLFADEFRVYQNRPDIISVYNSLFHRDKWEVYSDKYKSEHIAKGIQRISSYLVKLLK